MTIVFLKYQHITVTILKLLIYSSVSATVSLKNDCDFILCCTSAFNDILHRSKINSCYSIYETFWECTTGDGALLSVFWISSRFHCIQEQLKSYASVSSNWRHIWKLKGDHSQAVSQNRRGEIAKKIKNVIMGNSCCKYFLHEESHYQSIYTWGYCKQMHHFTRDGIVITHEL